MKDLWKKIEASALAAALCLSMVPVSAARTTRAAVTSPQLSFTTGDANSASIVTGSSINIAEAVPTGYTSRGLNVSWNPGGTSGGNNTVTLPENSGITFTPSGSERSLNVAGNFDPQEGKLGTGDLSTVAAMEQASRMGVYAVKGDYYALRADGTISEKGLHTASVSGTARTTSGSAPIMQYSTITIQCDRAETDGQAPGFTVVKDGTGAFNNYKAGKDGVPGSQIEVVGVPTQDPSKTKVLTLRFYDGNNEIGVEVYPQLTYNYVTKNEGTSEDTGEMEPAIDPDTNKPYDPARPIPKDKDNYIRKGTTFEIQFRMPESNSLLLTVMTPQYAIEQIENQITQCNGINDTSFIKLHTGDSYDYITDDFDLRYISEQFNSTFHIDWKWIPFDENGDPMAETDPDYQTYKNVLIPGGGNAELQTARIAPLEDDVKGQLQATVTYTRPNGTTMETATQTVYKRELPAKALTIRGIGKPVEVTQVNQTTGKRDGDPELYSFKENETKLPDVKKMDAYQGGISSYNVDPVGPYMYELEMNMGAKNGAASYATITAEGNTGAVTVQTRSGSGVFEDYTFGDQIQNKQFGVNGNTTPGKVSVRILANRQAADAGQQTVTLTAHFFIPDRQNRPQESSARYTIRLNVVDNTPSQDSTLSSLTIRDQDGDAVDYGFTRERFNYTGIDGTVHLPYKAEQFDLTPIMNDARGASHDISITVLDTDGNPTKGTQDGAITVKNGKRSKQIDLSAETDLGIVYKVQVVVPSQDPRPEFWTTYLLDVVRDQPSEDNTLASLGIYFERDENLANNLIQFDPATLEYNVEIPYSTKRLRVRAAANHDRAKGPVITPELAGNSLFDPDKQWLNDLPKRFRESEDGLVHLTFVVTSEAGVEKTYTVNLRRLDPNDDPTLSNLTVTDVDDNVQAYRPAFQPETETYTVEIPYSLKKLKFNLTPTDVNFNKMQVYQFQPEGDGNLLFDTDGQLKPSAPSPAFDVLSIIDSRIMEQGYHPFFIVTTAEDEHTTKTYEVRVQRAEPSTDATLASLVLQDQNTDPIKTLAFHPDEYEYVLQVPYEMTNVNFTPTATHQWATIQIKDDSLLGSVLPYDIASGATSKFFPLKNAGEEKRFEIIVTAEDGTTQLTYTVRITRDMPSSDARLKGLKVDNVDEFSPLFTANKNEYTALVSEGADGVVITATANHPGATIRIDGNVVESGVASDLIELIDVEQRVTIEVIAQDGVTRNTYIVDFTNQNLIEKTNNADLRRLTVNHGLMTPDFQPAVTNYEVTATERTYSVDIIPELADELATYRVLQGTRELGDYNGNYAIALEDGENPVTIEVTSPDGTLTKNYEVTVFRNVEEKLKEFEPLQAEDIDYENSENPILVKIEEFPRVGASVFTELRNYPEKSIVFQGNDYSLRFDASNLSRVIPQAEIYDFRMTFDSPDKDAIYSLINGWDGNADIVGNTVMCYFYYHGSLPGPAALNINLSNRYGNQILYWHYYNQDRNRIDYYGALHSNAQGTIAVSIDHFSTYLVTPGHRLVGSEDRSGVVDVLGEVSNGRDLLYSGGKLNPNTGDADTLLLADTAQVLAAELAAAPHAGDMPVRVGAPSAAAHAGVAGDGVGAGTAAAPLAARPPVLYPLARKEQWLPVEEGEDRA